MAGRVLERRARWEGLGRDAAAWPTDFSIYSAPGVGTALVCRFWPGRAGRGNGRAAAGLAVALRGETECGDAWTVAQGPAGTARARSPMGWVMGPPPRPRPARPWNLPGADPSPAGAPARRAARGHAQHPRRRRGGRGHRGGRRRDPVRRSRQHQRRGPGRGQAAGASSRTTAPSGCRLRKIQEFGYPWPPGALLVVHSDGLATHWRLEQYPGPVSRRTGPDRGHALSRLMRGAATT